MSYSPDKQARQDAERVRGKAFWHQVLHTLRGVPNELMPFDVVRNLNPVSESYGGVQAISVGKIVGSVDRYKDFDHYFLPRYSFPLNRWIGIRRAKLEGKELPAIQVYKVGDIYFVKDGHHRVSVARDEGQLYIDAEIIELGVQVRPDAGDSVKDFIIKGEYTHFLQQTRLDELRPGHYPVLFTVPGRYDTVLEHLRTHEYYLGREHKRPFAWEEIVMSWYDTLYVPVVVEIRRFNVLRRFPGRKEADLYVWIMDHRHYVREQLGVDLGNEHLAQDYALNYAPPRLSRVWQRAKRVWRGEPY